MPTPESRTEKESGAESRGVPDDSTRRLEAAERMGSVFERFVSLPQWKSPVEGLVGLQEFLRGISKEDSPTGLAQELADNLDPLIAKYSDEDADTDV